MAADNRDRAMAGVLRQSLGNTRPKENCLDAETIAAYYEHALDASLTSKCEAHLAQCSRCRQQIAMMVRAESSAPARYEAKSSWIWNWRFIGAAAAALLVLTVWGLRHSTLTPGSRKVSEPLVAMSKPSEPPPQETQTRAATSARPPAAASESKSAPSQKLDRLSPLPQPPQLGASDVSSLQNLKKSPAANSAIAPAGEENSRDSANESAGASASAARPAAKSLTTEAEANPSAPAPQPASAPPVSASSAIGGLANEPAAHQNERGGNALSIAKQAPLASRIREYAAANQAPARQAEQRSAETIIATPDPKVLWRIAGGGFVERSEDMGATWNGQLPLPNAQLTAGSAPTAKTCWLVGHGGTILLTKDGSHWSKIPPPVPANFVSVSSKNASSAIITTSDGQKFSTSDGGRKWTPSQ